MRLLLDTHTFLWFVNDNPKLSDRLIIAQSIAENIPIATLDSAFNKYSATLIN